MHVRNGVKHHHAQEIELVHLYFFVELIGDLVSRCSSICWLGWRGRVVAVEKV